MYYTITRQAVVSRDVIFYEHSVREGASTLRAEAPSMLENSGDSWSPVYVRKHQMVLVSSSPLVEI